MAEPIEQTLDDFFALGAELHRLDRFHPIAARTSPDRSRVGDTAAAPRVLVSAAAVPYRAHRGVYVIVRGGAVRADVADGAALLDRAGRRRRVDVHDQAGNRRRGGGPRASTASRCAGSTTIRSTCRGRALVADSLGRDPRP